MKVIDLIGREILDSRGNPTVECEMFFDDGNRTIASVPSGASTGIKEALELRDKDFDRYHGMGVLEAINNINTTIKDNILNLGVEEIDDKLLELDSSSSKTELGANAILAVSLCALKGQAIVKETSLYGLFEGNIMPIPMMNIINGGKHADNNLSIQEFMIVPKQKDFKERLRCGSEIFHTLKGILHEHGYKTSVGDEGGFAPDFIDVEEALDAIVLAIEKSNYEPGKDVSIALDCAASSFYNKQTKLYEIDNQKLSTYQLISYYKNLVNKYPIISIEDPFDEMDIEGVKKLTLELSDKIMIVGDDTFVTKKSELEKGIKNNYCNAILLKANQVGTIKEMLETIELAKTNNYKTIISHRSGETEDTFIADLAVGLNLGFIKTGSLCRGERIAKYNRLLRIEEEIKRK